MYIICSPANSKYVLGIEKQTINECEQLWDIVSCAWLSKDDNSMRFLWKIFNVKVASIKIKLDHYYLAFYEFENAPWP